jgi:hypothetical protein
MRDVANVLSDDVYAYSERLFYLLLDAEASTLNFDSLLDESSREL